MAGSPGDSPVVLKELIEMQPTKKVYVSIADPAFVEGIKGLQIGSHIDSKIGATWGAKYYEPIEISGELISLSDASFKFSQRSYSGMRIDMGLTAVVRIGNIYLVATSKPATTTDPAFYKAVGLDVNEAQIVIVKTHAGFRDGYRDIAKKFYLLKTPGMSSDDIPNLPYKNISRPIFPWDQDTNWSPIHL
jgi:microcystin degradation protein MlrC